MSDIISLDPRLLLAFVAITEEGSVTRAAERMNLTQQGLSGVLARLRDQFDDPLFVRTVHGVIPTPRAEVLYPKIITALESLRNVMQEKTFDPSEIDMTFRIATSDYALSVVIHPLFERLRKLAPKLKLVVVPLQIKLLADQMRKSRLDLALTVPEFVPDNLYSSTLFTDRYKCAFRKGHPLATQKMTIKAFCEVEHLLVAPNGKNTRGPTDIALAQTGHSRSVAVAVPNFLVAESLLAVTDLLAMLPTRLLNNCKDKLFVTEPPIVIPSFDIVCVWPERVHSDPFNIWFREILRILIGDQ